METGAQIPNLLHQHGLTKVSKKDVSLETSNGESKYHQKNSKIKYSMSGLMHQLAIYPLQPHTPNNGKNGGKILNKSNSINSWEKIMYPSTLSSSLLLSLEPPINSLYYTISPLLNTLTMKMANSLKASIYIHFLLFSKNILFIQMYRCFW